jgi:hypothetical protein
MMTLLPGGIPQRGLIFRGEFQMRLYKVTFVSGLAAGFVLGTRAGRERYDQMCRFVRSAADNPAVQQTAGALHAHANAAMTTTWKTTVKVGRDSVAKVRARRHSSGQSGTPRAATSGNGFVPKPTHQEQRPFVPVNGEFGDHDMI